MPERIVLIIRGQNLLRNEKIFEIKQSEKKEEEKEQGRERKIIATGCT